MPHTQETPPRRNWSGLLLIIPSVLFLLQYMTDTDFTLEKQLLATVFAVLLFVGAIDLAVRHRRELQRVRREAREFKQRNRWDRGDRRSR